MEEEIKKAEVLAEAYQYIREYRDKVFVIKFGGSILKLPNVKENILKDVAFLEAVGVKTLLVCGGGPFINEEIEKRGKKPVFVDGLRVTDSETMKIVEDILFGIRDNVVEHLKNNLKVKVSSLQPSEKFITAKKVHYQKGEEIIDLGFVGQAVSINTDYVNAKLEEERVLVMAPIAHGEDGHLYNINGDAVASAAAEWLKAEKLVFITDVLGVMRNPQNSDTLISILQVSEAEELIEKNVIKGGMIPKVKSGISSIKKGVKKVHIISGNIPHSIVLEVFTEHGIGTEICN